MEKRHISLKIITSNTCGCCESYKAKIDEIAAKYDIDVEYADINGSDMDLSEFDFKGIPFTVVYTDGQYRHHFQGDMPVELIMRQIGLD